MERGAQRLTGHAADEVVGRDVGELLVPRPSPREGVPALSGAVSLRHRGGHVVDLVLRVHAVLGGDRGFVLTSDPEPAVAEQVLRQASAPSSVFDADQRLLWVNDETCRILGRGDEALVGRFLGDLMPQDPNTPQLLRQVREVFRTGDPVHFESYSQPPDEPRELAWNTEMWPVRDDSGEVVAVGVTAFDGSEQHWARQRLALLNEAAAEIGTTLDVVRTAEEPVGLLVPRFAEFASVDLLDWVLRVEARETVERTDVMMRRVAHRSLTEGTPEAVIGLGETDIYPPFSPPARALAEGRPVLSGTGDPAFDRWMAGHQARGAKIREYGISVHSMLAAPLRARGATLGVAVFIRATNPFPFTDDDVSLVEELTSRAAVCVDNAHRYTRERATALTLQHSLLPQRLPRQAAVDAAHRYLPAGSLAGVGGDWFDVIPLSGSRVALVVGDVVGHGVPSSATMGRLRTALRTLADVDLPPDEILTHVDDLVIHLAADDSAGEDAAELGATCLYAVYDPVSRHLIMASAGHPPPAILLPDGTIQQVRPSPGPPLGIGGLPFEATDLELPEGSLIALYTDGLIEDRDRDIDEGITHLERTLAAHRDSSLDIVCDAVLKSLLPERPSDDVALLLARTRALGVSQVAAWDVAPDPAEVATARQLATDQLTARGLDETAFITELIVSELVTNAIRYGAPPIRLRLIRDSTLICEVSDASSTSPHLRRAHVFDEGGRGLMLVAQLSQRWGSRQTTTGKTIWTEQALPTEL